MSLGCFRDKTYCASPNCKNECGRKMSSEIEAILKADKHGRTSYAYFCGEPECHHESDGLIYTSNPPQNKCKKCGEFYR